MECGVGKINCKHTCDVQWKIENYFTSVPQTVNTSIKSPCFYFSNGTWYLILDPNGRTKDKSERWFGLFLMYEDGPKNVSVDFTLGILRESAEACTFSYNHVFVPRKSGYGGKLIKRSELYEKREKLLTGGTLTVFCRANILMQQKDGISTLSEDLKNLFVNEKNYDATIKVKDRSFNVHKTILGSRSPVLSAMFEHDMKIKNSDTVIIDDCEPDIFHDFLLFLYSEETENLSPKNAASLYYLADKYFLRSLKEICLEFMMANLNMDNICEVVTLADRYHEEQLMETASEWIKNNLKDVVRTDKWITFMAENTVLGVELLRKAIPT